VLHKLYRIALPLSMRYKFANCKRQFEKLATLWKVTPSDCRGQLLTEFVLRPADFERRFAEEADFRSNTMLRWRR
jgi:hypothetical protein